MGGWWVGGSERNEINAILNSVEVKVWVELGKNDSVSYNYIIHQQIVQKHCNSNVRGKKLDYVLYLTRWGVSPVFTHKIPLEKSIYPSYDYKKILG